MKLFIFNNKNYVQINNTFFKEYYEKLAIKITGIFLTQKRT